MLNNWSIRSKARVLPAKSFVRQENRCSPLFNSTDQSQKKTGGLEEVNLRSILTRSHVLLSSTSVPRFIRRAGVSPCPSMCPESSLAQLTRTTPYPYSPIRLTDEGPDLAVSPDASAAAGGKRMQGPAGAMPPRPHLDIQQVHICARENGGRSRAWEGM
jgi:hypothetical protein